VIEGVCLGGGLEFALACRHRVARDDSSTKLGLPEIQLGLIPGWGGTQRLPRLIGVRAALRMILEGNKVSAKEAAKMGLVDSAFSPETFESQLSEYLSKLLAGNRARRVGKGATDVLLDGTWLGRHFVFREAHRAIAKKAKHYPALPAALAAIKAGVQRSRKKGMALEREGFVNLLFTDTARNLIELFFQRERAGKIATWAKVERSQLPAVKRVAVLGGGIMGSGIAQLAALSGYDVVLKELNAELAAAGMKRVESLMDEAVRKGVMRSDEARARLGAITPTTEWEPIQNADLAIEAVVEREGVKREIFTQLGQRLRPEAILATNTSSLTVARVAEPASGQQRVGGLHFFNPVHKMQLVEVVRGPDTDSRTVGTLVDFVRRLGKTPVVVADGPGFLVNRILFPYLDEAIRLLDAGFSTQAIDRAATSFGMPMGPLELFDHVGLDVAAEVARSLHGLSTDPSPTPEWVSAMVQNGLLGRKSGHGFYAWTDGRRGQPSHWGEHVPTHRTRPHDEDAKNEAGLTLLQQRLLYPMVNEAAHCLETGVADAPWVVDLAMVLGTGFAPFTGGPLRAADSWGIRQVVGDLEKLHRACGDRFEPCPMLREMRREGRRFYPEASLLHHVPAHAASAHEAR
jgi:3-hydroxyacyl-CoA dehydrogenase/enoyl-CoA hydratase/3-hydroxybutyryl-CoA epimerase